MTEGTPAILCIEDDELDRDLVAQYARPAPVQFARDLDAAAIAMETGIFDVIVLDLGLPTSQGLDTCLRARDMWPETPIVVHSGTDDERLMEECIAAGADDYLVKHGSSPEALMRAIRFAIDRRRRMAAELASSVEAERRRALEKQLAMQTALVRTIGHELNTPLTPIRLRLGLLARHDDPDVRRGAETIRRNMERLQRSLANALEAWQMSEDRTQTRLREVAVRPIIQEVLHDCGPVLSASGVEVNVEVDDIQIQADPDRLFHLMANLISNAAVYAKDWVKITAAEDDGNVAIEISNGGRLPAAVKRHLFEPFVNRHRDDDQTAPGAGLGIHVAKTLADSQNLRLALVSDDPVSFRLRARRVQQQVAVEA